jgi:hypothetical protein
MSEEVKKGLNLNKSLRKLKDFSPLWRFKVTAIVKPYTQEEFGILWTENSAAAPHPIHFPFMDLSKSLVPPDSFSSSPYRSGISLGGPYSVCRILFMPIYTVDGQAERKTTNAMMSHSTTVSM